jgi:type VI secretion system lysozyme-like protein
MESRDQYPHLERDPRPSPGLRAPLFERLTGSGEGFGIRTEPYRTLQPAAVIESVRQDLQRLLNTRRPPGAATSEPGTTVNYGIPDFAGTSPADIVARDTLATAIAKIIEAFEPRIGQVRVTLAAHASDPRALTGAIEGRIRIGLIAEPVSFPLDMRTASGAVVGSARAMAQSV